VWAGSSESVALARHVYSSAACGVVRGQQQQVRPRGGLRGVEQRAHWSVSGVCVCNILSVRCSGFGRALGGRWPDRVASAPTNEATWASRCWVQDTREAKR
jgi:hypothetical protein